MDKFTLIDDYIKARKSSASDHKSSLVIKISDWHHVKTIDEDYVLYEI